MKITGREIEIIRLLAAGWSSKSIADKLGIAKNTVDTHRRNMLRKTASKNTLELISNCQRLGLLTG